MKHLVRGRGWRYEVGGMGQTGYRGSPSHRRFLYVPVFGVSPRVAAASGPPLLQDGQFGLCEVAGVPAICATRDTSDDCLLFLACDAGQGNQAVISKVLTTAMVLGHASDASRLVAMVRLQVGQTVVCGVSGPRRDGYHMFQWTSVDLDYRYQER